MRPKRRRSGTKFSLRRCRTSLPGHRPHQHQPARRAVAGELRAEHLLQHVEGQIVIVDHGANRPVGAADDLDEVEIEQLVAVDERMPLGAVREHVIVGPLGDRRVFHAAEDLVVAVDLRAVHVVDQMGKLRREARHRLVVPAEVFLHRRDPSGRRTIGGIRDERVGEHHRRNAGTELEHFLWPVSAHLLVERQVIRPGHAGDFGPRLITADGVGHGRNPFQRGFGTPLVRRDQSLEDEGTQPRDGAEAARIQGGKGHCTSLVESAGSLAGMGEFRRNPIMPRPRVGFSRARGRGAAPAAPDRAPHGRCPAL